jgi:hypothetical protein
VGKTVTLTRVCVIVRQKLDSRRNAILQFCGVFDGGGQTVSDVIVAAPMMTIKAFLVSGQWWSIRNCGLRAL